MKPRKDALRERPDDLPCCAAGGGSTVRRGRAQRLPIITDGTGRSVRAAVGAVRGGTRLCLVAPVLPTRWCCSQEAARPELRGGGEEAGGAGSVPCAGRDRSPVPVPPARPAPA
nr:hypothetical protein StreXyl84_58990 [Streptomyces sp. Xyl84]